jgi:site-specific recombinase XerD
MTTEIKPFSGDFPCAEFNAAQALDWIAGATELPAQRRRDLASAIRGIAFLAGLPDCPELVVLTPQALRTKVLTCSAAAAGISQGRMRNIRSGLRYVLRQLNVIDDADTPLSSAWADLLGRLEKRDRAGLIGLARFCSARQLDPTVLTETALAALRDHLTMRSITVTPIKLIGTARKTWNRLAKLRTDWPGRPLAALAPENQFILPLAAFPVSFQTDVALFGARLQADPLDDVLDDDLDNDGAASVPSGSPPKPLRPSSAANRMDHARWAASALLASGAVGTDITAITSLSCLVVPIANAREILRFLKAKAAGQPSAAATHIAGVLRMVARYHVGSPDAEIKKISTWAKRQLLNYERMTPKNRQTIDGIMVPDREAKLLALPSALMAAAELLRATAPLQAASLAMRALAIEFLSRIPLRLANLIGLRIDRHLQRPDPRSNAIAWISIAASETKNTNEILVPVSLALNKILHTWITVYRPIIAGPGCAYLFPGHGTGNRSITPQGMRDAVRNTIREHVGIALTPHQFRHLAASRYLEAHPDDYETLRRLLGHKNLATTVRSYAPPETGKATARFDDIIEDRLRVMVNKPKGAKPKAPRPTPRGPGRSRHV